MSDQDWRPLPHRQSGEPSEFDVLHEGIPAWLEGSLWRWLMSRATEGGAPLIERLERRLHIVLASPADRPYGAQHTAPGVLIQNYWAAAPAEFRLTFLDALLRDMQLRAQDYIDQGGQEGAETLYAAAVGLNEILVDGGSVWGAHVDFPDWVLIRRVNDTTAALVQAVSAPDTHAAREIRHAWTTCYQHHPDPDAAYRHAVLAVEAVTIPVTIPDSPRATLGQVVSHVRDTISRYSVAGLDATEIASGSTLLAMLQTLWHNQQRHAQSDGTITNVSQQEAEAAVSLAVLLVHWFSSSLVHRTAE